MGPRRIDAASARDPSVAASTIRRDELSGPGQSAADALRGEVGVSIAETGGLGAGQLGVAGGTEQLGRAERGARRRQVAIVAAEV